MLPYAKINTRQMKKIIDDLFTAIAVSPVTSNAEYIEITFNETKVVLRLWEEINLVAAQRLIYCFGQKAHKVTYTSKVLLIGEIMKMIPSCSPIITLGKNPTYRMYKLYINEFVKFFKRFTPKFKQYFGFNPLTPKINISFNCYRSTPEFSVYVKLAYPTSLFDERHWDRMYIAE